MDLERAIANSENEVVKFLVNVLGTEMTLALIKSAGGGNLYIPLLETIIRDERDNQIYEEFINGATYKKLSMKYRRCEKVIREIVNKQKKCAGSKKANDKKGEKYVG